MTVGAIQPGLVRLLISCPDRPGIVANVSRFLYEAGANIVSSAQYSTDPSGGTFFLRMEFTVDPDAGTEGLAERFGLHIPVEKDRKQEAEARQLELLEGCCDLVVLARYMQVLSPEFLDRVGVPVININHSFLPAFAGAGPYVRAKERGVKLVGATAHYVTEELDAGPIIEQDVMRVGHRHDADALAQLGAEVERLVLARAVQAHCEDRVLRHGNTTVVF